MGSDQTTPQKYTCVFSNAMHLIMLMKGFSLDKTSEYIIYIYGCTPNDHSQEVFV